jgi:dihydrofolate reductase
MTVTLVAAVADNGVIGNAGGLPWHLPEDLRHFKRLTMGHVLVLGRRTYESIGRALPGRTTVVISRQPGWRADGVQPAASWPEALALARCRDDEVFVGGGAEVFAAALPDADRLVITHVPGSPQGDTWFPPVDCSQWRESRREPHPGFEIATYERATDERTTSAG